MALTPGTRLGPYEILALIGAGGMGRVYRARDTKLDREVAIKVLPEEFASDSERLARFEREARLLASLNHPNIASIHGFEEPNALVLELVEGPTLAERIAQGPIPVDEAITIAKQIAEALEGGHEAGVIHRDLKPANIKLKEDGTVKVLDYGLAKALERDTPVGANAELSQSPTLTRQGTQTGVILGTASYMSPEQAKGKRVDRRADIWAFGAVLYEMLTGKRAFEGEDVSDTLAAVLRADPDLEAVPAETPGSIRRILQLCLTKDPKERVRDIGDVRLAMQGAFETRDGAPPPARGWGRPIGMAAVALLLVGAGVGVWQARISSPPPRPVTRVSVSLPPGNVLTDGEAGAVHRRLLALSPDGTRLVFAGNGQLYLREMDQMQATPIRGSENAQSPFFSPDGEWIGFWAEGWLKKVAVHGGSSVNLCRADSSPLGAQWRADDRILFGQTEGGIMQVSGSGGTPELVVPLDATGLQGYGPQVLPGGRNVILTLGQNARWDDAEIVVHSLETGERKVLIHGGRDARYVPTGHLVYVLDGTLLAVPFDLDRLDVSGATVAVVENIMVTTSAVSGDAQFSFSDTGSLVYATDHRREATRTLVWVDRNGNEVALTAQPDSYNAPRISPQGDRIAFVLGDDEVDLWTWHVSRETLTRFTVDPGVDNQPVWSTDGQQIVFESHRTGQGNLFTKPAHGSREVKRLTESPRHHRPLSMAPDGAAVLLEDGNAPRNLSLVPFPEGGDPQPLLHSEFNETNGEIAPDGRWLAYQSDKSGQNEVYVRPFPNIDDDRWKVSRDGGTQPVWSPNGRELFYVSPNRQLVVVPVSSGENFALGPPEIAVAMPYFGASSSGVRGYDISPDGERFLILKEADSEETSSPEIILVQNWFEELKRMVPAQ